MTVDDNNGAPPAPKAEVSGFVEEARELLTAAFAEHGQGERISLEVWIQALPRDAQPGAPTDQLGRPEVMWEAMLMAYVGIPGIQPGTQVYRATALQPFGWTPEVASNVARQVVAALLEGRAGQLEAMQREAQQAAQNGSGAPLGGLIVPGRGGS